MGEHCVAERTRRHFRDHYCLHGSNHFTCLSSQDRAAEDLLRGFFDRGFQKTIIWPVVLARGMVTGVIGTWRTRNSNPRAAASFSVRPTCASSGSVKSVEGTYRSFLDREPFPKTLSRRIRKSSRDA